MRVTWVQPEDLVGHARRQAREEGKDVDDVERRGFAAGGAPAPGRGASQEPGAPELRSLAGSSSVTVPNLRRLRCLEASPTHRAIHFSFSWPGSFRGCRSALQSFVSISSPSLPV